MNAKSKFSIPILSGTRPEVGLFSATVAAPSLRNASNLVAGVPVSSHPMITTGVTSNNSIAPYVSADGFNYLGGGGYRVSYPGTNAELADNGRFGSGNLLYLNSSKKTIQLDNYQEVTGDDISDMMVNYLKTGKMEGDIESGLDGSSVFAAATNSIILDTHSFPAELYDCSPNFNDVSGVEVTAATQGASYQTGNITARMVYFTDKDGVIGTKATGFVLGTFTSNGAVTNPIQTGATTLLDGSIGNIPVDGVLTVEDGQAAATPTLIIGGANYTPNTTSLTCTTKVISQGLNPSSVSGQPGQGIIVRVSTSVAGVVTAVNVIDNDGSGYNEGDILELFDGINGQGATVLVGSVNKDPSTAGTLATPKVTSQYRPGSGAPIGPYDSYTVESIKLPNGTIKHLALNSEENICQSKVPKARVFTAGGHKAYYPQISSGLQPTNWNSGVGAALCANPALCLPVGIGSQDGQTIVNGVPV
jgi:hypothetical protein